ncbi:hypothetical protein G3I19_00385 [Streptomyces sp. SID10853]|uniref:hypothetical protein n=1 Tax=Streptomyces sp. SID10853 TaxID=2706028 RepID=UPI0013BFE7BD|nr:hypothetical protein [Streptomyces sp. SID10853]NDZ77002.1 hypothetical protein [Streptomyces sp. SID10853]
MTTAAVAPEQFYQAGLHVPFIAPWSNETPLPGEIVKITGRGGSGIGYADELSQADRRRGTLWVRQAVQRGRGTSNLAAVHPLRQRQAMSHMLCQVCGRTTYDDSFARWGERHLVITRAVGGRPISDGEKTTSPPVCEPCAVESIGACPHLRKGYAAALVEWTQFWGVAGIVYDPTTLQPIDPGGTGAEAEDGLAMVPYESPLIRWTLAARDVSTLHGCTPIDLADLATYSVANQNPRPAGAPGHGCRRPVRGEEHVSR